jgi:endonuclease III
MLFEKLRKNKGIVSSKLGKELAEEVLNGNEVILHEAIKLVTYDLQNEKEKNIRAGAAKILEKVSEKKPEMVSPYLSEIYKAFEAKEV